MWPECQFCKLAVERDVGPSPGPYCNYGSPCDPELNWIGRMIERLKELVGNGRRR